MTSLLGTRSLYAHGDDQRELLHDITLDVHAGEVLGLIGPNGAGKSTLLQLLAGLHRPSAGEILLDGLPIHTLLPDQRAKRIAYLEQRPIMHWPFAAQQVVALGRLVHGDSESDAGRKLITQALEHTGAQAFAARAFDTLSEGEKLLVHLARVLAGAPAVLLADEPTAALDPANQLQVMRLLRQQARRGLGVVVILQDLTLAARFCDRLLLLQAGAVMAQGEPAQVLTRDQLRQTWQLDASYDEVHKAVIVHDWNQHSRNIAH